MSGLIILTPCLAFCAVITDDPERVRRRGSSTSSPFPACAMAEHRGRRVGFTMHFRENSLLRSGRCAVLVAMVVATACHGARPPAPAAPAAAQIAPSQPV